MTIADLFNALGERGASLKAPRRVRRVKSTADQSAGDWAVIADAASRELRARIAIHEEGLAFEKHYRQHDLAKKREAVLVDLNRQLQLADDWRAGKAEPPRRT